MHDSDVDEPDLSHSVQIIGWCNPRVLTFCFTPLILARRHFTQIVKVLTTWIPGSVGISGKFDVIILILLLILVFKENSTPGGIFS
ncbi:MAG: hypothetical protein ABIJ81_03215 [Patescibacteria group bacterium]